MQLILAIYDFLETFSGNSRQLTAQHWYFEKKNLKNVHICILFSIAFVYYTASHCAVIIMFTVSKVALSKFK